MNYNFLEKLELELLKPKTRKSVKRLSELLAEDFLEIGMTGKRFTKKDILEILPKSEDNKYEATDFETKEIAPNTILLTYKASVNNTKTNEITLTLRSSIWQKQNNNWQMIFHQGTIVR